MQNLRLSSLGLFVTCQFFHFGGILENSVCNLRAAQNTGQLFDTLCLSQTPDLGPCAAVRYLFFDTEMSVRHGRDLMQMTCLLLPISIIFSDTF